MSTPAAEPRSLGAEFERSRLEHRARRIDEVLVVLRLQRTHARDRGQAAAPLDQAIAGFGEELGSVRTLLRKLG
jgi:hypothetical protein